MNASTTVRIRLVAVCLERAEDHPQPAVGHDGALERRFGLEADDDLVVAVDVPRRVRRDRTWYLRDVEHAFLALFDEQVFELLPDPLGAVGGRREESGVALVGRVVLLEEPADVDVALPQARLEPAPGVYPVSMFHDLLLR